MLRKEEEPKREMISEQEFQHLIYTLIESLLVKSDELDHQSSQYKAQVEQLRNIIEATQIEQDRGKVVHFYIDENNTLSFDSKLKKSLGFQHE